MAVPKRRARALPMPSRLAASTTCASPRPTQVWGPRARPRRSTSPARNGGVTPDASSVRLELDLLGGIALRGLDAADADRLLAQPKLVALLAYLAVAGAGGRWQRRDHVVVLL